MRDKRDELVRRHNTFIAFQPRQNLVVPFAVRVADRLRVKQEIPVIERFTNFIEQQHPFCRLTRCHFLTLSQRQHPVIRAGLFRQPAQLPQQRLQRLLLPIPLPPGCAVAHIQPGVVPVNFTAVQQVEHMLQSAVRLWPVEHQ
ncbi:hypothetical protein F6R83_22900 [Citrobacter amalonaticus]|nr:hypothetical protein [Citrobacter amalonaticus]